MSAPPRRIADYWTRLAYGSSKSHQDQVIYNGILES
jgi:hypothetical protein